MLAQAAAVELDEQVLTPEERGKRPVERRGQAVAPRRLSTRG